MRKRILCLDIVRVICMTYIVGFWHISNYTEYSKFIAESKVLTDITLGILGGFIFLSGFLGGAKRFECVKEIFVYYKKRFITIYPLFLVSCFSLFFITRMGMGNYIIDLKQLGLTLVGMACFVSVPPKTVWFISMLIPLYIVTPLYNKLSMKLKLIVIIACYTTIVMKSSSAYSDVRVFYLLPIYFIGLMLGYIFFAEKCEWTKKKNTFLLMTSSIATVVLENLSLGIGNEFKIEMIIVKSIYILLFILFLFTLSYGLEMLIKNNKWISILENISVASLTCYLFHRQFYFVLNILFGEYNSFFECAIFFLIVLIISVYIQKYYDKVLMLYKKSNHSKASTLKIKNRHI